MQIKRRKYQSCHSMVMNFIFKLILEYYKIIIFFRHQENKPVTTEKWSKRSMFIVAKGYVLEDPGISFEKK